MLMLAPVASTICVTAGGRPCALSALSVGFEFVREFPNRVRSRAHYNRVELEHMPGLGGETFKQLVIASSSWPKHEAQLNRTGRDELVSQVLILRSLIGIFFLHRPFV